MIDRVDVDVIISRYVWMDCVFVKMSFLASYPFPTCSEDVVVKRRK